MTAYSPMPDIEAVVATALQIEGVCGGRVHSSIPAKAGPDAFPMALVKRLGGTPVERHRLDAARIQVDIWGGDKGTARDEADKARLVIHELEGTTSDLWSAAITGVNDELGLFWSPDPDSGRDRYIFSVVVYAHSTT